jgi:hypothetical protein
VDVVPIRALSVRVDRGTEADSPNPLGRKSWFSGLLSNCGSSLFTGLLRGRRRENDRAVRIAQKDMDRAVTEIDTEGFFRASRQVVRNRIAGRFNLVADAIAVDDARKYLPVSGLPDLIDVADCIIYSGQTLPQEDLAAWRDRVHTDLQQLER